jgi:hypothetical protein
VVRGRRTAAGTGPAARARSSVRAVRSRRAVRAGGSVRSVRAGSIRAVRAGGPVLPATGRTRVGRTGAAAMRLRGPLRSTVGVAAVAPGGRALAATGPRVVRRGRVTGSVACGARPVAVPVRNARALARMGARRRQRRGANVRTRRARVRIHAQDEAWRGNVARAVMPFSRRRPGAGRCDRDAPEEGSESQGGQQTARGAVEDAEEPALQSLHVEQCDGRATLAVAPEGRNVTPVGGQRLGRRSIPRSRP